MGNFMERRLNEKAPRCNFRQGAARGEDHYSCFKKLKERLLVKCSIQMLGVVAMLLTAAIASAQTTTATIYGRVTDPSSAAVPGATVVVTNEATNAKFNTSSQEQGDFTVNFVPVGKYTIAIDSMGFTPIRQTGIEVSAGQKLGLEYKLELGSVVDTITVSGGVPLVNTISPEQTESKSELEVRELPLKRRDWTGLINIGTGVTTQGAGVTMNGLPSAGFRLTVGGTDAEGDPEMPSLGMAQGFNQIKTVSLEAMAEVNVTKGIPSAEIANAMAGGINIITKSGTNEYHGSLFLNNQVEDLAARSQFASSKGPMVFNQFGGSIGGPIIKNKLFAFGAFEAYRERNAQTVTGFVPTKEFREQAVAAVPGYKPFLDLFPLPTGGTGEGDITSFYVDNRSSRADDNHAVVRADYLIRDDLSLSARYTRGRPNAVQPRIVEANDRSYGGVTESGTANLIFARPSWTSETRVGVNHNDVTRLDGLYSLGLAGIAGDLGFGMTGEKLARAGETISLEHIIGKSIGRHNLKAGALYMKRNVRRDNEEAAELTYSSLEDLLSNTPSRVQVTWGTKPFEIQSWQAGFFLQDDFRVSSRLTMNIGVRYDYYSVPTERDGRLFNYTNLGGARLDPDSIFKADRNNFSPRLGLVYKVDEQGKTVVRAGVGMFTNPHNAFGGIVDLVQNAADEPFRRVFSRGDVLANAVLRYPVVNADVLPLVKGQTVEPSYMLSENFPNPYSLQWMLGLQRQLSSTVVLETGYVANVGVKLNMLRDYNQVDRVTGERPYADYGQYRYIDASDRSSYQSWQSSLRKRFSHNVMANFHYTWSRTMSYGQGDIIGSDLLPQDNNNLAADWGPAPTDVGHRFASDFLYELPFARLSSSTSRLTRIALNGWQVSGLFAAQSGLPFTVTTPSSIAGQRIDYLGGDVYLPDWQSTLRYLNPATLSQVPVSSSSGAPVRGGTLGRNALRMPGYWNVDLALSKSMALTERIALQLRADMLNAFNHTVFSSVNTNITSSNFGMFTGTRGARIVQMNVRLTF